MLHIIVKFLIKLFFKTYKIEVEGFKKFLDLKKEGKKICFGFWHGEQFILIPFFSKEKIGIMVSLSKDGEKQAKLLSSFGYFPIRGSSSKRPVSSLIEMINYLKENQIVGFALDGPKGPLYEPKPGILTLSYKTGAKILPLRVFYQKAWILKKTWDKYFIPKPFSKVKLSIRNPLELSVNL